MITNKVVVFWRLGTGAWLTRFCPLALKKMEKQDPQICSWCRERSGPPKCPECSKEKYACSIVLLVPCVVGGKLLPWNVTWVVYGSVGSVGKVTSESQLGNWPGRDVTLCWKRQAIIPARNGLETTGSRHFCIRANFMEPLKCKCDPLGKNLVLRDTMLFHLKDCSTCTVCVVYKLL